MSGMELPRQLKFIVKGRRESPECVSMRSLNGPCHSMLENDDENLNMDRCTDFVHTAAFRRKVCRVARSWYTALSYADVSEEKTTFGKCGNDFLSGQFKKIPAIACAQRFGAMRPLLFDSTMP